LAASLIEDEWHAHGVRRAVAGSVHSFEELFMKFPVLPFPYAPLSAFMHATARGAGRIVRSLAIFAVLSSPAFAETPQS
jgi:hypothetical protein